MKWLAVVAAAIGCAGLVGFGAHASTSAYTVRCKRHICAITFGTPRGTVICRDSWPKNRHQKWERLRCGIIVHLRPVPTKYCKPIWDWKEISMRRKWPAEPVCTSEKLAPLPPGYFDQMPGGVYKNGPFKCVYVPGESRTLDAVRCHSKRGHGFFLEGNGEWAVH